MSQLPVPFAFLAATLLFSGPGSQGQGSTRPRANDFDFLLGDWAFTAQSKLYGDGHGLWTAVRLGDGEILDEFRVLGDNGATIYLARTLRVLNNFAGRWDLVGFHDHGGLRNTGIARRTNGEIQIEQRIHDDSGKAALLRIRYHSIEASRFSWTMDRSTDEGKTWTLNEQRIEAKRIGAAKPALALTDVKRLRR